MNSWQGKEVVSMTCAKHAGTTRTWGVAQKASVAHGNHRDSGGERKHGMGEELVAEEGSIVWEIHWSMREASHVHSTCERQEQEGWQRKEASRGTRTGT